MMLMQCDMVWLLCECYENVCLLIICGCIPGCWNWCSAKSTSLDTRLSPLTLWTSTQTCHPSPLSLATALSLDTSMSPTLLLMACLRENQWGIAPLPTWPQGLQTWLSSNFWWVNNMCNRCTHWFRYYIKREQLTPRHDEMLCKVVEVLF